MQQFAYLIYLYMIGGGRSRAQEKKPADRCSLKESHLEDELKSTFKSMIKTVREVARYSPLEGIRESLCFGFLLRWRVKFVVCVLVMCVYGKRVCRDVTEFDRGW